MMQEPARHATEAHGALTCLPLAQVFSLLADGKHLCNHKNILDEKTAYFSRNFSAKNAVRQGGTWERSFNLNASVS